MEAHRIRVLFRAAYVGLICLTCWAAMPALVQAAQYKTPNFVVNARTPELAERIGRAAEKYRHILAIAWTGKPMPDWASPCPITAEVAPNKGAGGETSFLFDRGEVYGWKMRLQGSEERVLDSVLPHEVTHTIFASHFRRPLPRWADEGACTTVEHESEKSKQHKMLYEFLRTNRGISFDEMFAMRHYPQDVLPLYAQGYSLARFLIQQGGRLKFVKFLNDGMESENWAATLKSQYGFSNLKNLQEHWLAWVKQGSPVIDANQIRDINEEYEQLLAAGSIRRPVSNGAVVFRGQNEDRESRGVSSVARISTAENKPSQVMPVGQRASDSAGVHNSDPAQTPARNSTPRDDSWQGANVRPESGRSMNGSSSIYDRAANQNPLGRAAENIAPPSVTSPNVPVATSGAAMNGNSSNGTGMSGALSFPPPQNSAKQILLEWGQAASEVSAQPLSNTNDVAW